LNAISELLHNVPRILKPGGWFLCEIGFRQGEKANALAMETGCYRKVEILKDINSHDRMLKVQRK
jgi:methylase of polypeptide subunit release factors